MLALTELGAHAGKEKAKLQERDRAVIAVAFARARGGAQIWSGFRRTEEIQSVRHALRITFASLFEVHRSGVRARERPIAGIASISALSHQGPADCEHTHRTRYEHSITKYARNDAKFVEWGLTDLEYPSAGDLPGL